MESWQTNAMNISTEILNKTIKIHLIVFQTRCFYVLYAVFFEWCWNLYFLHVHLIWSIILVKAGAMFVT